MRCTKGDWVAWVGRYEDIVAGREVNIGSA